MCFYCVCVCVVVNDPRKIPFSYLIHLITIMYFEKKKWYYKMCCMSGKEY